MQFKYPELLWGLLLLLIPILIHLFQLRRFKKTPFTNVKFLKKVVAESRRSNTLKKWLLLLTRLLLLAAFVLAFAQPFFAKKSALKQKETVIYLDDSFSMQLKKDAGATLLEEAVQELIRSIPKTEHFSIFTNQRTFKNVVLADVQNDLLALPFTDKQLTLNEIYLKGENLFADDETTEKNLVVVSDFQLAMADSKIDSIKKNNTHIVRFSGDTPINVAIDSVFLSTQSSENKILTVLLSSNVSTENIPVSLFNNDTLTAKTAANFNNGRTAEVNFTLADNMVVSGKIEITDNGLTYDNRLYFNIDRKEKIKVLAIGPLDNSFLKRIYSEDEFIFSSSSLKNLNYGDLSSKNLILLNGLQQIPASLTTNLMDFTGDGGHLVIIPGIEIDFETYNTLLFRYFSTAFTQSVPEERNITDISFSHPLYRNVFEKNVTNFQYPKVSRFFRVKTTAATALSFQDAAPFLVGSDALHLFTASLATENSNFHKSPLIIPTFYNFGTGSLKQPRLYNIMRSSVEVDVPVTLSKDNILKVSKDDNELIPRQKSFANRVSLVFDENLLADGIYSIRDNEKSIGNISFNYARNESELNYLQVDQLNALTTGTSIVSLFEKMEKDNTVDELWKWFVILAILFLLVEILIQKYLK